MSTPLDATIDQLSDLGAEQLDVLSRGAVAALTRVKLYTGRLLMSMQNIRGQREFGCSKVTHYAAAVLRLDLHEAKVCRRVAFLLDELPVLSEAAEAGTIPWSALVLVTPRATPETEAHWLKLAQTLSAEELARLARSERLESDEVAPRKVELRTMLDPETAALYGQAARSLCEELGRRLDGQEVVAALCFERLTGSAFPSDTVRERMHREALRDLEAEDARTREVVAQASEIIAEFDHPAAVLVDAESAEPLPNHWDAASTLESVCPGNEEITLVRTGPSWQNQRLRYNPESRLVTEGQRREILRRDVYACSTPDCPHTLWLNVHHVVWYSRGGLTVPENLVTVCFGCHQNLHSGRLQLSSGRRGWRWTDRAGRLLRVFRPALMPGWIADWFAWPPDSS